jgi:hypothetical protein
MLDRDRSVDLFSVTVTTCIWRLCWGPLDPTLLSSKSMQSGLNINLEVLNSSYLAELIAVYNYISDLLTCYQWLVEIMFDLHSDCDRDGGYGPRRDCCASYVLYHPARVILTRCFNALQNTSLEVHKSTRAHRFAPIWLANY